MRERDLRNRFRSVDRIMPRLMWDFARRPLWSLDVLRGGVPEVELVRGRKEFGRGALAQAGALSRRLRKDLTWETVADLRGKWPGSLIVKGISGPADAALARDAGVDGIVLSNLGGRQLDQGASTVSLIRPVRAALGEDLALYVDSGFRRGTDIFKALALGADCVLMGRPFAWAVAAEGERGAAHFIALLRREIEITLNLAGVSSVAEARAAGPAMLFDGAGRAAAP